MQREDNPKSAPRRYVAVVQDPRGYPSASLSDDDVQAPELYTVVKCDEHEAEVLRLREAAEKLAHAVSASLTHGERTPLADALHAYLGEYPWSDL